MHDRRFRGASQVSLIFRSADCQRCLASAVWMASSRSSTSLNLSDEELIDLDLIVLAAQRDALPGGEGGGSRSLRRDDGSLRPRRSAQKENARVCGELDRLAAGMTTGNMKWAPSAVADDLKKAVERQSRAGFREAVRINGEEPRAMRKWARSKEKIHSERLEREISGFQSGDQSMCWKV